MKKLLCIVLLFVMCSCSYADTRTFKGTVEGDEPLIKVLRAVVNAIKPEKAKIIADGQPSADGKIGRVSMFVHGANYDGYRVEYAAVDIAFAEFNPVSEWTDDFASLRLKSFMRGNLELRITQKDINEGIALFHKRASEKEELKWGDVSIRLNNGKVFAKGKLRLNGSIGGIVEIESGLVIKKGKQLWLADPVIHVNDDEQTDSIRKEIQRIQPLFDLSEFSYPIVLRSIELNKGNLVVTTATKPADWDGAIIYEYTP